MKVLKLKGKTLKGKNRIREHGELWLVLRLDFGHGALVQPAAMRIDGSNIHECRWINAPIFNALLDKHFEVEELR